MRCDGWERKPDQKNTEHRDQKGNRLVLTVQRSRGGKLCFFGTETMEAKKNWRFYLTFSPTVLQFFLQICDLNNLKKLFFVFVCFFKFMTLYILTQYPILLSLTFFFPHINLFSFFLVNVWFFSLGQYLFFFLSFVIVLFLVNLPL